MPTRKRLQFSINISAPVSTVYTLMIAPETYQDWTSAFAQGSRYEGSWSQGQRIHFLSDAEGGLVSEIAENRPNEFISVRHLGYIVDGVEETDKEATDAWAPAYENYTFHPIPGGTRLTIDQDATAEFESYLVDAWPKALDRLKALCEAHAASQAGVVPASSQRASGWGWD